jgi:PAS domain S-box-containing protein
LKLFPDWKARIAFGFAVLTLLLMGTVAYRSIVASENSDGWVLHTDEVLGTLNALLLSMESVQSSSRGFVLTGDDFFLTSYDDSASNARQEEASIRSLTVDNPRQQVRLPRLESLVAERIEFARQAIALRRTAGFEAAADAVRSGQGQQVMTQFQAAVRTMKEEEMRLIVLRGADAKKRAAQTKYSLIFEMMLAAFLTAGAGWSVHRDSLARKLAEEMQRDGEDRFRNLATNISQLAWMADEKGSIFWYNERWYDYFGATAAEIARPGWVGTVHHPEHMQRVSEKFKRSIATGEVWEDTFPLRGADGVYRNFLSRAVPIRDGEGKVLRWFGTNTDISEIQQSEKDLAGSEDRYRGLLEAAPDAMVVVSQSGEIVLLNLQAEKHFGYRRDELIGQEVTNIIPEGFAERLIADGTRTAAEALAQQIGTGIELNGRRKDGSEFPIEIMLSPLDSAEGILVTAAIRDITVRKDAEKHLAQMEARYRGLLEAAPDGMVVVNQRGEIVLLNARAEKQFGYWRDELLGQKVKSIIPEGFAERLIADGTRTAAEALAQQIGTGIELIGQRKDGSEFPVEIMLSPLDSAEGILVTAAIRDITLRRDAEKHLAQVEGRYRGLLEAAPDGMVVVNERGEIVLLNAQSEKQFGYLRNELIGRKVKSIIPEGFAERLIADGTRTAAEALAQHIGTGIELYGLRKDGSEFPIEIMLSPLESAEGILVTAAIRDITTRKEVEAHLVQNVKELNRSNEELEQFAYVASHDLQEPLRMVASYTQLLSRRYKGKLDSDADDFIAFAVDGANRMQRLIQDLLTFSRVGKKGQDLVDVSSADTLRQAILNLRGAIEDSGAIVTHGPMPEVKANEIQLTQLFQNLVGNAIKYQGPGTPHIHISAVKNGSPKWIFSVQDDGLGIDPQFFERIFGMFQRLHKRDEFAGTGMGLAICKKIVERHGGSISVDSTPGKGSTFHFALAESERK